MKCTYCPKEGVELTPHVTLVDTDGSVQIFCDKDCVTGWVVMTAVDDALARGDFEQRPGATPEELRGLAARAGRSKERRAPE